MKRPMVTPSSLPRVLAGAAVGLTAVVLTSMVWFAAVALPGSHHRTAQVQDRAQNLATAVAQNQKKLEDHGLSTVGPAPESLLQGKATPPPTAQAPVAPETTVVTMAPDDLQLGRLVDAAVAAYFRAHPPAGPVKAASVVKALVPYVTTYLRAHPAPSGQPGKDGQAGHDPSQAQVVAAVQTYVPPAVAAYLQANPPPSGPAGSPGAQGSPGVDGSPGPSGPSGSPGAGCDPAANPDCRGPGPSQQDIADAVADYFAAHPLACPDGYSATRAVLTTDSGPLVAQVCAADDQPTTPPTEPTTPPPSTTDSPTTAGSTP